jgi:hypothetical protein
MPGRKPLVQVVPLLVVVAQPILDDPPSKKRPTWKALTVVEPQENVSGSTSLACMLLLFV